jgi:hypothetical protein
MPKIEPELKLNDEQGKMNENENKNKDKQELSSKG